ncbi:hypothetical protein G6F57_006618 [Rhizopus arrhizus]|uniref:Zn(2)-C6 fungal-type domain-containing protein n=1 Tax=Rhizopus oryzae TaxID=64495 RepID=A0A9P6X8Q9_RHIOR|nr:hypothetical protein G6F23_002988 [Rhizopus arrhizus]KAG1419977.1 hypothetical protein G6F58_004372 [Rhizopus delemar]KAG0767033.1 hypothetical protein G6F24_003135 [Rhizopus arrhizus]KAG0788552.1 hypothetical protein G6F21_007132 [Rhizopus arrhizus]KAG0789872.1 hypothetical protein G6F22_006579 [Rhizopus arrhizus]
MEVNKRRSSIASSESKRKSPKACIPCRKRKVKCDGNSPCDRCLKTDCECKFDKIPVKKEVTAESHKAKLKRLKERLDELSTIIDHTTTPPSASLSLSNQLNSSQKVKLWVTETGQGCYIPDNHLRIDRLPSGSNWERMMEEIEPKHNINEPPPIIRQHLLNIYFQYIDTLLPILHKPSFYHQLNNHEPVSSILLNAIYCVSSRWDMNTPIRDGEPRGWCYYEAAVKLLDQEYEPQLSTVQALLLLLKYNEHVRRRGFLWRTSYYFQMIVRMCKDLGLQRKIVVTSSTSPKILIELEKRKRTFWAVYCYDVMMSIENGVPFHFNLDKESHVDDPQVLMDEVNDQEKIIHFILLTKIIRCQAQITQFLHQKLDSQWAVKNMLTNWKEEETFEALTNHLKESIGILTSYTSFPEENDMSYAACFLYLASCFATISLHRPFAFQNTPTSSPHTGHCAEAAFNIRRIMGLVFRCEALEDMYCSIRGIHQIMHYVSAAITVFKEGGYESELRDLMQIALYLSSTSPVIEMNNKISTMQQSSTSFGFQPNPTLLSLLYTDDDPIPNI